MSSVIQGVFISGRPRVPARVPGAPAGTGPAIQRYAANDIIPINPGTLNLSSSPGRPLPEHVQRKMEALFNADFSDVRVHSGPQAHAIGALAFTLGSNIYFAPGHYSPDTPHGHQLLGHELTHVLQQRAGRVRNPQGQGIAVVQDHVLEAEAERMGARAAAFVPPSVKRNEPTRP
jgi:hypothetical protein